MKLQTHIDRALDEEDVLGVFGLILYTDEHPHVVKVLRDKDYWKQFAIITGDNFAIFSAKPLSGTYLYPSVPPGSMGMMVPVWNEPSQNKELLSTFHLDDTKKLPKTKFFREFSVR